MKKNIYFPKEDSFLLNKHVLKFSTGNVLDLGTGSGIQGKKALESKKTKKVYFVDLNSDAINFVNNEVKDSRKSILKSDLFDDLQEKKLFNYFNLIIFNPPYLPGSRDDKYLSFEDKIATVGGKKGNELIIKFIQELNLYLKSNGICLLLFSSLSRKEEIFHHLKLNLFDYKIIDKENQNNGEILYVLEIKKNKILRKINKKYFIEYYSHGKHSSIFRIININENINFVKKKINKESPSHRLFDYKHNHIILKLTNKLIKANLGVSKGSIKREFISYKKVNKLNRKILKLIEKYPKLKEINNISKLKIHIPKAIKLDHSNDFLVREFIEANTLIDFIKKNNLKDESEVLRKIYFELFKQSFLLDLLKLNKKEMNHPKSNILITKEKEVYLIDFERMNKTNDAKNHRQFLSFYMKILKDIDFLNYSKDYKNSNLKEKINLFYDMFFKIYSKQELLLYKDNI